MNDLPSPSGQKGSAAEPARRPDNPIRSGRESRLSGMIPAISRPRWNWRLPPWPAVRAGAGKGMSMEGNTDRFTRVLLLWLELHSALALARARQDRGRGRECAPWDSPEAGVREVWRRLTDPANQLALEQWLYQSADGQPAEWARQALRVCRERSRQKDPASS
jgi:hypothetical protein